MTTDRSEATAMTVDRREVADADEALARQAYAELERLFVSHVTGFMVEAGRYIIDTFYGGDPRAALIKRRDIPRGNSLRVLIDKIRSASDDPSANAPSVSWFYRAISLAAHEMIFASRRSVATLRQIGLSHKLLLLAVPKITINSVNTDGFEIDAAFDEKERLAQIAIDEHLSVRDFAQRIKAEHPDPSPSLSVDDLPGPSVLRRQPLKTLRRLYDRANARFDDKMAAARRYRRALDDLGAVLAETADAGNDLSAVPASAVGFCIGCASDCRYCRGKIAGAADPSLKQPADWRSWELQADEVSRPRTLMDGPVAFPAGHDIFPEILTETTEVMGNLLLAGNSLTINCRPRLDVIEALCDAGAWFKDRIEFRCAIGAADDDILSFWEPRAPGYEERKAALAYARAAGFRTSAAATPMLDTDGIAHLVRDLTPHVSEAIWLGAMPGIDGIKNWSRVSGFQAHLTRIQDGQAPERLAEIKAAFGSHPLVQWMPGTFDAGVASEGETPRAAATPER